VKSSPRILMTQNYRNELMNISRLSQLRSQCLDGVHFISEEYELTQNSQILEFKDSNSEHCDINVGHKDNVDISFYEEHVQITLGDFSEEDLFPLPDIKGESAIQPIFPLVIL